MSSLTRARSLRKPAGPTALPPKEQRLTDRGAQDPNRNISPSRLPTKPALRPAATSSSASAGTATGPTRATSGRTATRPGSASSNASSAAPAPRRSVSLGKKPPLAAGATSTTTVPPARKDTHRYPPLSSATRPNSMVVMRPTSAGSTTTTTTTASGMRRTTPTHTRANSAAVTGAASKGAPTATSQERKSRSRPPSRDPTSSTAASASAAAPGTPKRRAVSADKPPTTPTTATSHTPRLNRTPFHTLQQQRLSPAKTSTASPRPTTSATPARPASPSKLPANIAAAADTSRLQAELLQLHLLHRDAAAVEAQWTASAKAQLGQRFRALRDAHLELASREAAHTEADNVAALQAWADHSSGGAAGLHDKLRALDTVVGGVWAMSEPGGKYARVVRRFERWIERVMDLEEARDNGTIGLLITSGGRNSIGFGGSGSGSGAEEAALFIQDLDQAWTDDCASMTRKLERWQEELDIAGEVEAEEENGKERASVVRMVHGAGTLVADMCAELGAMEEIRQAALAREEKWIEVMNRDDDENDTPRAGAVWRAM